MPVSAEFQHFLRILRNSALAGDIGDKHGIFWSSSGGRTVCIHDFTMKYMDGHSGSDARNTENIKLSLSEILPVYLVDRLHLSVAVIGDKYCIFGRVQGSQKINYYMWKICHIGLRNLANRPTEFGNICCGKLWSLLTSTKIYRGDICRCLRIT